MNRTPLRLAWLLIPLTAAFLGGCATTDPSEKQAWSASTVTSAEGTPATKVTFLGGDQPIVVRKESFHRHYRVIPSSLYTKYNVPKDAVSAYSGEWAKDNDVLYVVDGGKEWKVYGFTFGLFDIDWPPKLVGTVAK